MRRRSVRREVEADPFYDMLFNMLIAFVFCFIVALLAMNPKALKAGDIPSKAEYIISVSWPDMNPNDIDTWVQQALVLLQRAGPEARRGRGRRADPENHRLREKP